MSIYVKLAKQAGEYFVLHQESLPWPTVLPAELGRQCACYISVLENPGRRPRAFYGDIMPRQSTLAQEIVANTIAAITQSALRKIRRPDLSYLVYSVALIGPLQKISDATHLDPFRAGLYIRSDQGKMAVLLPQRAGVETPDDQIATALRESHIDVRQEAVSMYRFEVDHYDT